MPQRVVLASIFEQQDSGLGLLLKLIYTEAFRQLGVALEIRGYPAIRAGALAVLGEVDGETARTYEYETLQSTMMRVPESILTTATAAYVHDPQLRIVSWEGLKSDHLRVEFRAGYVVAARRLAELVPAEHLSQVTNGEQGLKKLALGRTDVYVDVEMFVDPLLASGPLGPLPIYKAGVLQRTAAYPYLNHRHVQLAARLAEVLRKMKADGVIERMRARVFDQATGTP